MRFKPQHLLPKHIESSRREYETRTIETAFDLRTRSYDSSDQFDFRTATSDTDIIAIGYSQNGEYVYILGNSTNTLYQFSLCPHFDINTAVLDDTLDFSTETTAPVDYTFKPGGLTLAIVEADGTIYEYTLFVAWDIGTATYSRTIDDTSTTDVTGIVVDGDGDYVVSTSTGATYNMSSPVVTGAGDMIAGVTYLGSSPAPSTLQTFVFNSDGTKAILAYGGNGCEQYILSTPFDINTKGATPISTLTPGWTCTHLWQSGDGKYINLQGTGSTFFEMSTPFLLSSVGSVQPGLGGQAKSAFSDDGFEYAKFSTAFSQLYLYRATLGTPFDITTRQPGWQSVQQSNGWMPGDISFSSDGAYMYQTSGFYGIPDEYVYQRSCSPPFDAPFSGYTSIATMNGSGVINDVIRVSAAGDKAIILDKTNNEFRFYSMGTLSINQVSSATLGENLTSGGFSNDGTKWYLIDSNTGTVQTYNLSTAYDTSTASGDYEETLQETDSIAMAMGYNGNNMVYIDRLGNAYQERM